MLGRLIKHEMKATSRILIPSFIVWIAIILFSKLTLMISTTGEEWFVGISVILMFVSCIAISVATLVIIISRFYKSTLGDRGYLTFTLPVKTESIIFSKLIVASIWNITLVTISIFAILIFIGEDFEYFRSEVLSHFTFINTASLTAIGTFMLMCTVYQILTIYTAIAIASLFNKHRVILSFAFYLVFDFVFDIVSYCVGFLIGISSALSAFDEAEEDFVQMTNAQVLDELNRAFSNIITPKVVLPYMIFWIAIIVALFIAVSKIFKKHLNLY